MAPNGFAHQICQELRGPKNSLSSPKTISKEHKISSLALLYATKRKRMRSTTTTLREPLSARLDSHCGDDGSLDSATTPTHIDTKHASSRSSITNKTTSRARNVPRRGILARTKSDSETSRTARVAPQIMRGVARTSSEGESFRIRSKYLRRLGVGTVTTKNQTTKRSTTLKKSTACEVLKSDYGRKDWTLTLQSRPPCSNQGYREL